MAYTKLNIKDGEVLTAAHLAHIESGIATIDADKTALANVNATVDANTGIPSVTVTASGPSSATALTFSFSNLKGEQGDSPIKGVDYWTVTDQESIVQDVIKALGTPIFGRVDTNNNITLTGELTEGIYTLWYEDKNGKTTKLCTYDTTPEYTNWLKRSVEIDDTPYNGGQGWKANTRLNSRGLEATASAEGIEVSGFIPVKLGDIIYFKNIVIKNMGSTDYPYAGQTYLATYDKDKNLLQSKQLGYFYYGTDKTSGYGITVDRNLPDGNIIKIDTGNLYVNHTSDLIDFRDQNMAYFRISCEEINDDSIITINQKIEEDEIPDVEKPNYDNWIPYSTEVDGVTLYNGGKGYKVNTRWSKSGGGDISETGVTVSGYIPVKVGDVIRIKNITMNKNYQASIANVCNVCYFWSLTATDGASGDATVIANDFSGIFDANGNLTQFTIPESLHPTYIRLNTSYIGPDSILTINEEIPEDESTYTNLFDPSTATLNTRMSGTNQQPKAADGYVMSAMIHLPLELTLTDSYDDSTPYIAVPSTTWANSANLFGYRYDGAQNGYMSADGTAGTIVGDWVKIPLYNQWGGSVTVTDFVISLYVSASAITESDIQDIKIYFNECPGDDDNKVDSSNLLLSATDVNGTIYNGTGYKEGIRINSSGKAVEAAGCVSTGFIPVKHGDTIKLYNILYPLSDTPLIGTELSGANYKIALYNSDKTALSSTSIIELGISTGLAYVADENDYAKAITLVGDDSNWWGAVAYFRITATEITSKSVITVHNGSTGLGDIGALALTWTEGIKIDKNTGTESSDSAYGASQMFDITAGYNYTASQINRYGYSAGGISVCYYDANETYLGYEELWPATPAEPHSELLTPLAGAVKFRLRLYHGGTLDPKFYSLTYEKKIGYTNLIPLSINSDGSAFVGANGEKGYKAGYRLNSSGTETAEDGMFITGFIAVKQNDVVRLSGIEWGATSAKADKSYLQLYKDDFTKATDAYCRADSGFGISGDEEFDASGNLVRFTLSHGSNAGLDLSTVAYMRLSSPSITADSIITVNEEIPGIGNDESGLIAIELAYGVKLDKNSGAEGSATGYAASQNISYDPAYTYTMSTSNDFHAYGTACWYDASGKFLGWNEIITTGTSPGANNSGILTPLDGASTFRLRIVVLNEGDENRISLRKDLI